MTIENVSPLASLGWESSWATAFAVGVDALGIREAGSVVPARVIAEHRQRYVVADGQTSGDVHQTRIRRSRADAANMRR